MKPQLHQKATFYPHSFAEDTQGVDAVVTRIWSDTCVNLAYLDHQGQMAGGPTSVLIYQPDSGQAQPGGYYCVLHPIAEPEQLVQPKITGYRQLSEEDAALMNEIKAQGEVMSALITKIAKHLAGQHLAGKSGDDDLLQRHTFSEPHRWMAMARSELQAGLMKLTRAVAQPSGF